jgi:ATP adenylyltransferase
MNGMALYYLGNHRTDDQLQEMLRLEAAGVCVFCPRQLFDDPGRPAVLRTTHWTAITNQYPYRGTSLHLLLVPDQHVVGMTDLGQDQREDFWRVMTAVQARFDLAYYGLGVRNGDPMFTGGTIYHLHVHVIVGDPDSPDQSPVRMKLSSRPRPDFDISSNRQNRPRTAPFPMTA